MNNSTQLNLSVNGVYRTSMIYPRIQSINSIDYNYDSLHKIIKIEFNCEIEPDDLSGLLKSVINNAPHDFKEIQVNLSYSSTVTSELLV